MQHGKREPFIEMDLDRAAAIVRKAGAKTREQEAAALGLAQSTWSRLLTGQRHATAATVARVMTKLDVRFEVMFRARPQ